MTLTVRGPGPLLKTLFTLLPDWHHNTLKDRLHCGGVRVNGKPVTAHDHVLQAGDVVEVLPKRQIPLDFRSPYPIRVLHEDVELILIKKPEGLLSVPTAGEERRTAVAQVTEMLRARGGSDRARLWPVHRLDRETSGILMLARSRKVQKAMQEGWGRVEKTYWTVVRGVPRPPEGTVSLKLKEDRDLKVRVVKDVEGALDARTDYRLLAVQGAYSLLEVKPRTGRKHQIRAHLSAIGHPVVGDAVYGGGHGAGVRLALHAKSLRFTHPVSGATLTIECPWPGMLADIAAGSGDPLVRPANAKARFG